MQLLEREHGENRHNWLVLVMVMLALAVVAMAFSGCMSDGNGNRVIDWDQVDKLTERGLALYDRYQDQQDAEAGPSDGTQKLERAAFWASSGVAVVQYRSYKAGGLSMTESAIKAIEDANRILTVIGIDKTYIELATSVFADEPDRPSDVDTALEILRESIEPPVDEAIDDGGAWGALIDKIFGADDDLCEVGPPVDLK